MGSGKKKAVKPTPKAATAGQPSKDASTQDLQKKQKRELEDLTLTTQPFKTLQLFCFAILQYTRQSVQYVLTKGSWFMTVIVLMLVLALVILNIDGPHEKHVQEFIRYTRFVLWWVALGVASSIGLGSGLHTFVLYLGPHIAFFTIKAMKCGRIDLKRAPYDTIQLESGPSWLEKDCSEFGPPLFSSPPGSLVRVPIGSVIPQVYLEAILWGFGTALGELPPYFISRAASLSGSKVDAMDDLDAAPSRNDGLMSANLKKIKLWFLSHSQHLNFGTILVLASVPNPLFDLAGIMCGQFGIPFWKFFLPTLFGKAIIKTYLQTVFIISLCNNQLLEWVENEFIWVLGHIPGFSSKVPDLITKLHMVQKKYLSASPHSPAPHLSDGTAKPWKLSFTLVWNTFIWLMLMNFFAKIVTSTAQRYLKLQQLELHNRKSTKNSELESEA